MSLLIRSPNRDSKNGGKNRATTSKPDEKQIPISVPTETTTLDIGDCITNEDDEQNHKKEEKHIETLKTEEQNEDRLSIKSQDVETTSLTDLKNELNERETRNSNSASPRSHRNTNDEPDIHPELTLRQLQNPTESMGRRPGSRSHVTSSNGFPTAIEALEINEMFDFCGRRSRSRNRDDRRTPWDACGPPARQRRSSVAVMAGPVRTSESRSMKYFTPTTRLTPQSLSAVHYLSISPPRIRITDAHGRTSPERLGNLLANVFNCRVVSN